MFYHHMKKNNKIVKEPDKSKLMCISLQSSNHKDLKHFY